MKHDDRLDALAMLVGHFIDQMDLYDQDQESLHEAQELDKELDIHLRLCQGESMDSINGDLTGMGTWVNTKR